MRIFRDDRTGKIDWESIILAFITGSTALVFLVILPYLIIQHQMEYNKQPEIRHTITQLDNSISVKIWRKDKYYLNNTVIIVDDSKIKIKSKDDILEIPIKHKIIEYEMKPIRRVSQGLLGGATVTDKIRQYVIHLKVEQGDTND